MTDSRKVFRATIVLTAILALSSPLFAQQAADEVAPEATTSLAAKRAIQPVKSKSWMVSVANPYAANAAANVLAKGGSAADAAIAAQLVLGLIEPQSSGLGGGAFVVHYNATTQRLTTLDGRETAPLAADSNLFLSADGEPLKFFDAVIGGRSVGTPGTPALLDTMHSKWGELEWSALFDDAIPLAENGFIVSSRLSGLIERNAESLARHAPSAAYFLPNGQPLKMGVRLQNPAYADTLKAFLNERSRPFYQGQIATDIISTVKGFSANPGLLEQADFNAYQAKERPAVCAKFLAYNVCGMGPPSSGALTLGQILQIVEPWKIETRSPDDAQTWRLIGDASRLAFADRGRYMADSDFIKMPTKGLLKQSYTDARSRLLKIEKALEKAPVGEPEWDDAALPRADDESLELPSTSHLSIVDAQGNIVSMTTTIENGFGSRLMTNGFLLNNELTDFSFRPERNGKPIANRVEPGKRPRSSMSPTIVMKEGKPVLVIGSPGGSRIIPYVANAIIAHLAWGENIQQAIARPHLVNRFGTYDLEKGTSAEAFEPSLQALGFKTNIRELNSGLHAISITPEGLSGGADPRREGIVLGK
ncbi:gamma-glutamyltransferase [Pseudahrensia aquimaris]|uniref:Glutathione hydrolase proenzyme n=1 Tax=Pseudahrensia aquimaris TaxID=744461 RepID=A0ABW3FAJ2_9HYPH